MLENRTGIYEKELNNYYSINVIVISLKTYVILKLY